MRRKKKSSEPRAKKSKKYSHFFSPIVYDAMRQKPPLPKKELNYIIRQAERQHEIQEIACEIFSQVEPIFAKHLANLKSTMEFSYLMDNVDVRLRVALGMKHHLKDRGKTLNPEPPAKEDPETVEPPTTPKQEQ